MNDSTSGNRASNRPTEKATGRYPTVISVLEVYGLEEAKRRLGWSNSAFRSAKRRGLRVLVCGKRRYLAGREIVRFLEAQQETASPPG